MSTRRAAGFIGALGLALNCLAVPLYAQDRAAIDRGNAKFQHSCAPCHGAGPGDDGRALLPGTDALRIKYRGTATPAVLEQRSDLPYPVLRTFVRQGSMSMPPFRPTELTDEEIEDIAAYLAESSKSARGD
jgi:mono/diheme cytochrome c family protein